MTKVNYSFAPYSLSLSHGVHTPLRLCIRVKARWYRKCNPRDEASPELYKKAFRKAIWLWWQAVFGIRPMICEIASYHYLWLWENLTLDGTFIVEICSHKETQVASIQSKGSPCASYLSSSGIDPTTAPFYTQFLLFRWPIYLCDDFLVSKWHHRYPYIEVQWPHFISILDVFSIFNI